MRRQTGIVIAALAAVCLAAPTIPAIAAVPPGTALASPVEATVDPPPEQPPVTELIVKYKAGVAPTEAPGVATGDSSVSDVELEPGRKMSLGLRTVELSEALDVDAADEVAAELAEDPRGLSASPNLRVFPADVGGPTSETDPDDPYFDGDDMWSLNGTYGIDGPTAWETTTGSSDVVVAVLDTGILSHEDLAGSSQVPGFDMIADVFTANDGTGRDTNPTDAGDWVTAQEEANDPEFCQESDSSWHGTHVTGTINAASGNNIGVASVAPGVKTQAVRVLGKCGGYSSDIIDGIVWASGGAADVAPENETPADVINMSLGGFGDCSVELQGAIDTAVGNGSTVVVAAGNSDENANNHFPANCDNTVTVAAIGEDGKRASFSNYGPAVDIAAPGVDIWSTANTGLTVAITDTYQSWAGTSMATPHVSGLAALIKSEFPDLTPAQVEARLKANVMAFPGGTCDDNLVNACGTGIANAAAILAGSEPTPTPTPTSTPTSTATPTPTPTSSTATPTPSAPPPVAVVAAPSAVQSLKATYKKARANAKWLAPASNGGAAIFGYQFRSTKNNGKSWTPWRSTTALKATVVRKKRTKNAVQVVALNSAGAGPAATLKLKRY